MPSHLQKAITDNQLGHFAAALTHAQAAIRARQDGVKPYLCAAFAAARLHGEERALQWVEHGLAAEPDNCLALATRAHLLERLHLLEAALESCGRWTELEPQNPEAQLYCARAYEKAGVFEPAIAAYARAAQLAAQPAAALTHLAILQFELGRRPEALGTLDRALAADPAYAPAWHARAEAKRFTRGDPDIDIMRELLRRRATEAHAPHERILLHYALAKAQVDIEEYPEALTQLRAGSALQRAALNYDPDCDERYMREMAGAFTAAALERLRAPGAATRRPIFIVGMPRSGTTLLEQVLTSHLSVFGGGESARMQKSVAGLGAAYPTNLNAISRRQISLLAERHLALLPEHAAPYLTDKTPYNFLHLGLIHAMFPEARIIHCKRDPVDTCVSNYSTWFAEGNEFSYEVRELARYYRAYARLMEHWRSVLPRERLLEVQYEKLVENFAGEARRVLEFCGLPWTDACLAFHESVRAVQSASKHQVRRPLYASSVGRARHFGDLAAELRRELDLAARAEPGEDR